LALDGIEPVSRDARGVDQLGDSGSTRRHRVGTVDAVGAGT
jgi:hypothetical protein